MLWILTVRFCRKTLSPCIVISLTLQFEKTHNADDAADNRKKQLAGVPDGNAIGSWKNSQRRDPNTPDVGTAPNVIPGNQAARWIYASRNAQHHTTHGLPGSHSSSEFTVPYQRDR